MLTDSGPTFYYVAMTGIKVGGHLLSIPETVFSTAGTLVDSGTVITRLPPTAYAAMRSSFASAMAGSAAALFAARAGQGLGAALLSPAALAIIMTAFRGNQRAKALAAWGAVGGAGAAIGVLVGGLLTEFGDWRMIFYVNLPVAVALAALGRRKVHGPVMLSGCERGVADAGVEGALEAAPGAGERGPGGDLGWQRGVELGE